MPFDFEPTPRFHMEHETEPLRNRLSRTVYGMELRSWLPTTNFGKEGTLPVFTVRVRDAEGKLRRTEIQDETGVMVRACIGAPANLLLRDATR